MFKNFVSAPTLRASIRTARKLDFPTTGFVDLYQNEVALTPFLEASDFVPCDFAGYVQLSVGTWTNRTGPGGALDASNALVLTFLASADIDPAQVAYGVMYTNSAGVLLAAFELDEPKSFTLSGDYLQFVVPAIRIPPEEGGIFGES